MQYRQTDIDKTEREEKKWQRERAIDNERQRKSVSYRKPITLVDSALWLFIEVVWSAAVGRRPNYRSSETQARTATQ